MLFDRVLLETQNSLKGNLEGWIGHELDYNDEFSEMVLPFIDEVVTDHRPINLPNIRKQPSQRDISTTLPGL